MTLLLTLNLAAIVLCFFVEKVPQTSLLIGSCLGATFVQLVRVYLKQSDKESELKYQIHELVTEKMWEESNRLREKRSPTHDPSPPSLSASETGV